MSIQTWLCSVRSRFVGNLRMGRATQRRQRANGHGMRGAVGQLTCGREGLVLIGETESLDSLSNGPRSMEATTLPVSEVDEPTSFDESVPVRLLFETPNIRLFEIGIDEVYGYANYGWAETSQGSWGAGGDASNSQAGGKSLWITLSECQSVSLRTADDWLIVSIDGHETQVCLAHEIEYLHVHGGGNTIDMTGIDTELLSSNLLIDLNDRAGNGTLIGRANADCLVVGDANDQFFSNEEDVAITVASLALAELVDALPTANATESVDEGGGDSVAVMEVLDSLFCDVAFIDTANLGGGAGISGIEDESLVTSDDTIAEDETLIKIRRSGPTRPRIRPGMEMNL